MVATAYSSRQEDFGNNKEPFLKFPSKLFEALIQVTHNLAELKVVLFIIGKTIGWRKDWDLISISQFVEGCNLNEKSVALGIKSAIEDNLIIRRKKGRSYEYRVIHPPIDFTSIEEKPAHKYKGKIIHNTTQNMGDIKPKNGDNIPQNMGDIKDQYPPEHGDKSTQNMGDIKPKYPPEHGYTIETCFKDIKHAGMPLTVSSQESLFQELLTTLENDLPNASKEVYSKLAGKALEKGYKPITLLEKIEEIRPRAKHLIPLLNKVLDEDPPPKLKAAHANFVPGTHINTFFIPVKVSAPPAIKSPTHTNYNCAEVWANTKRLIRGLPFEKHLEKATLQELELHNGEVTARIKLAHPSYERMLTLASKTELAAKLRQCLKHPCHIEFMS